MYQIDGRNASKLTQMLNLGVIFQIFRKLGNQIANRAPRIGDLGDHIAGVTRATRIENFFLTLENFIEVFRYRTTRAK